MGGEDETDILRTNEEYMPNNEGNGKVWYSHVALPSPRAQFGLAGIANTIYVVGGEKANGVTLALEYLAEQNQWSAFDTPTDFVRWRQLRLVDVGQHIYAIGGRSTGELHSTLLSFQAIYTIVFPIVR